MKSLFWIFKRLIVIIPTLLGVTIITFFISVNVPGDPVYSMVGERSDPVIIEYYRQKLGINKSIYKRYYNYLKMLLAFDLGESYYSKTKVLNELMDKIPNTLKLAFFSMLLAVVFGLFFGVLSAFYQNTIFDKIILFVSTFLISVPVFWFALILVYIFSYKLRLFPVSGMSHWSSIVLPSFTLGSRSMGYLIRLTRSCMIECLDSEYILTIRAKGGNSFYVFKHAFVNAVIPVITFIGIDFGSYMNGSVLTETIFGWDGIGRFAINGIFQRDYPVIIGSVLFGAMVFILINIIVDFICMMLNPKLRKLEL